ncbi:MotA/TolQ/ExbB proton channel family protein [Planctomycetes bacterium Pan216]|uniref:MotA/TolQ/ExbB proton channel family protein n=1 Tax=Kolteria novifilia TaxID=2527975 RepID=A0A518B9G8_9BACT|nr:MotA/TolQ/ExbB proton channel family protein [Planctomycetes bacterium Pan216]
MRMVLSSLKLSGASLAIGMIATGLFYSMVLFGPLHGTIADRYSTGHPVEYVTVAMFFWALADLLIKFVDLSGERRALGYDWLPPRVGPQPVNVATGLLERIKAAPAKLRSTYLGQRLDKALEYVCEKRSADRIEEHLTYLADVESERAHGNFAFVRLVAWMVPILGFLGTVIGITLAIANISPEQIETSLSEVTSGLAVAFDTTALALTLSIGIMFATFLVERQQQKVLDRVESFAISELPHRFLAGGPEMEPYLRVLEESSTSVIAHTEALVKSQADLWSEAFAKARTQDEAAVGRIAEQFAFLLENVRLERQKQVEALGKTTDRLASLEHDLNKLTDRLSDVIKGESQLSLVQQRLNDNLDAIRQTHDFEQILHSLTAAIHLMTARGGTKLEKPAA